MSITATRIDAHGRLLAFTVGRPGRMKRGAMATTSTAFCTNCRAIGSVRILGSLLGRKTCDRCNGTGVIKQHYQDDKPEDEKGRSS